MDEFFARNRLSAYLDGELSAAETREVEDALRADGSVDAALLENLNKLVNSLWELTSDEARIIRSAISEDFVALAS